MLASTPSNVAAISNIFTLILSRYFIGLPSITIIYETLDSSSTQRQMQQINLDAIELSVRNSSLIGNAIAVQWLKVDNMSEGELNSALLESAETGLAVGFITLMSSISKFLKAKYFATLNSSLRLRDRKLILIALNEEFKEDIYDVRNILKFYPFHIVLKEEKCQKIMVYSQSAKNSTQLSLLDTYWFSNSSFATNTTLYRTSDTKLSEEVIKVGAHSIPPFLFSTVVRPGDGNVDPIDESHPKKSILYDGAEALIFLEFCKIRNCTVRLHYYGKEAWGDIFPNGSSYGLYGGLNNRKIDVAHGLLTDLYSERFEISNSVSKIAVVLLAPKPMQYPAYLTIVLPFSANLWLAFLLTMFFCTIVGFLFDHFAEKQSKRCNSSQNQSSWREVYINKCLWVLALFLQTSSGSPRFESATTRIFTGFLLMTTLILENTYSGQLKSLLTVPLYMDPIDTTEKLIHSDLKWVGPVNKWVGPIVQSSLQRDQIISKKFEIMDHAGIKAAQRTGHYGVPVGKSYVYNFGDYISDGNLEDFIRVKDDVFFTYTRLASVKGWPLMDDINTMILWTLDHGLYQYWENKFADKYLDPKTQRILKLMESASREPDVPLKLNISNISGSLFILCFGLIGAGIIFVIERSTARYFG